MFESLVIASPKRTSHAPDDWEGFFPYYAGFPDAFARSVLGSAGLNKKSIVFDPWNGSGTTTFAATELGHSSFGFDLNPVMVIVARARLLPSSEADSLISLARKMISNAEKDLGELHKDDPLRVWFSGPTARLVRSIEAQIRLHLIGDRTITSEGVKLERISGLAAACYVALFSVCRERTSKFRSSNPTWVRHPRASELRISAKSSSISAEFLQSLEKMSDRLAERKARSSNPTAIVKVADTTVDLVKGGSVDFVLTSPPYCTRIDYGAATRIELAILAPLIHQSTDELRRRMIGSVRVPDRQITPQEAWGDTCGAFLAALQKHPSKASSGYYYKTHLDYFDKMARSLRNVRLSVKPKAPVVLVVQDSYYKELHNDLPTIIAEIASGCGLKLRRQESFRSVRSMSGINKHSKTYPRRKDPIEAVLCFEAQGRVRKPADA